MVIYSIALGKSPIQFLYWDARDQALRRVIFGKVVPKLWTSGTGERLKALITTSRTGTTVALDDGNGSVRVKSKGRGEIDINLSRLACGPANFFSCILTKDPKSDSDLVAQTALLYKNDLVTSFSLKERCKATGLSIKGDYALVFPLRGIPNWAMGGTCRGMRLLLPKDIDLEIKRICFIQDETIMPQIDLMHSEIDPDLGIMRLSKGGREKQSVRYDASSLTGCGQVALDVLAAGESFVSLNDYQIDESPLVSLRASGSHGKLTVSRSVFSMPGLYKARLRALGANAKQLGVCGDHFLVSVDP